MSLVINCPKCESNLFMLAYSYDEKLDRVICDRCGASEPVRKFFNAQRKALDAKVVP